MTPAYQTIREDSQRSQAGDCFRACVASILDQSIDVVPHFFRDQKGGARVEPYVEIEMQKWFNELGLNIIFLPILAGNPEQAMNIFGGRYPRLHYILVGQTIKGVHHSVVCRGNQILHDPARPAMGLHGPQENGFFTVCVIALSEWI
jgi:hypothetical protein